jgi:proteasome alpha subunit
LSMFSVPGAYDRAITVFSPDGRLFQVEYASETVKRGATVLGIASPEAVVLAAEERATSKLQDPSFMWKIFQIDEHVGAAVAGLSCDAHILVDQARIYAQSNRLLYDEPIDIEILTRRIGEIKQLYTQHAGVRPFGISILFGGMDRKGSRIFWTDPSGAYLAYKAWAIGAGGDAANEILEAEYKDSLTLDDSVLLALKCMSKVLEDKIDAQKIRIALIPSTTKKFTKLVPADVDKYLKKLESAKKPGTK